MIRMKNPIAPRLPKEYQEVEYIESTGTQYIDTGVSPYKTKSEIKFQYTGLEDISNSNYIMASWTDNNNRYYPIAYTGTITSTSKTMNCFRTGNKSNVYTDLGEYNSNIHTIIYNDENNKVYWDGEEKTTVSDLDTSSTNSIYIFAMHGSSGVQENASARIMSVKIIDKATDTQIRNFVPCYRKSDNEVGLYDLVNNQFYTNAGTGIFLIGSEVNSKDVNLIPMIGNKKVLRRYIGDKLVYGKEPTPYEQVVNYLMLYDGSLGDTELNECKDVTGGWDLTYTNNENYAKKVASDTYIGVTAKYSGSTKAKIATNNTIDLTNYKEYGFIVDSAGSDKTAHNYYRQVGFVSDSSFLTNTVYSNDTQIRNLMEVGTQTDIFYVQDLTDAKGEYYAYAMAGIDQYDMPETKVYIKNAFVAKQDDWSTLANLAGIEATTIDEILTNSETLLNNKETVEFMIYNCTGDFMANAIRSETFLTALNNSAYKTTIQANEHWNKFLNMVA